jgi:hypothetical protein
MTEGYLPNSGPVLPHQHELVIDAADADGAVIPPDNVIFGNFPAIREYVAIPRDL